ncbi:MFS transporter [Halorubrum sp. Atlit-8R]|uniref:MFS transporter n=1 Tax=unclassified Halorubrum TaxID=2642239 RepID=UPI000EF1A0D2|nr:MULTISPECIES: MFS transporter [unclassified Halorubrum]RLM71341.1 MFS transporter [Halorubrum sp. Atlit-9R]RLM72209.1 MFS transporter [Halorubrum sp. Atlit-9R]RLM82506.1 MFS transporter [Halorubrum sp. Atlit-8R]
MNRDRIGEYDALILVSLVWFLGKFVRYLFPPLFESIQGAYGVSNAVVGTAFTGFMIVYALLQFPSGAVADRLGPVRVIVAGALVAGAGSLAVVVDAPFAALVAAMLVIGAGTGVHKTVSVRLIARVYPARTGRMLGAHDTLGAMGGVAAPAVVVAVLSAPPALAAVLARLPGADWRAPFLLTGALAVGLAVATAVRLSGSPAATGSTDGDGDSPGTSEYLRLFRNPRFSAFVLVTVGFSFAHNGLVAFLPLYLSEAAGLATATANLLYSLVFAVTFVQLVTGDLSDRVGRFPVMVAALGLAAAALVALVSLPSLGLGAVAAAVVVALFGFGSHGFQPVRSAYLMELLPERLAGGGLGVVRTLLMGAGALAPSAVGILADAVGFRPAFALLAGSMGLAAVVAAGLWVTE